MVIGETKLLTDGSTVMTMHGDPGSFPDGNISVSTLKCYYLSNIFVSP